MTGVLERALVLTGQAILFARHCSSNLSVGGAPSVAEDLLATPCGVLRHCADPLFDLDIQRTNELGVTHDVTRAE